MVAKDVCMNNARLADGIYWEKHEAFGFAWGPLLVRNGMAFRLIAIPEAIPHERIHTVIGPLKEPRAMRSVKDQAHAALEAVSEFGSRGVQSEPTEA